MTELLQIHEQVQARVSAITTAREWPCRKGCDECCRRLASIPELTEAELLLLCEGLKALAEPLQSEVRERIRSLRPAAPVVCPFLDSSCGTCLVYNLRPVACRTYGFYVERDGGLYCDSINAAVERGDCDDVVWGNQGAIDRQLESLGPRMSLVDWFSVRLEQQPDGDTG